MGEMIPRGRANVDSPVLFLVFNRPGPTRLVFEQIRRARPRRLYVSADGPRKDRPGDAALCEEVRQVVAAVDWPCKVELRAHAFNLGTGDAVSSAIDWFFLHESEGIILEDDCLPDPSFFRFCDELLARYRDDMSVMSIAGCFQLGPQFQPDTSYFFTRNVDVWGWATWRRAWEKYDRQMSRWPGLRQSAWLLEIGGRKDFRKFWTAAFDRAHSGAVDAWDYQWLFSTWLHEGVSAVPRANLIRNIGFAPDATHTIDPDDHRANRALEVLAFPLTHPASVTSDPVADRLADVVLHRTQDVLLGYRLLRKAKRLLRAA